MSILPPRIHFPFVVYTDAHKDCTVLKVSALNNADDPVEAWRCAMAAVPEDALVDLCPVTEVSYVVSSMFQFKVLVPPRFKWSDVLSLDECKQLLDTPLQPCCGCGRVMSDCRVFEWRMCYECLTARASAARSLVDGDVDFTRVKCWSIVASACASISSALVSEYNQTAIAEGRPTLKELQDVTVQKICEHRQAVHRALKSLNGVGFFVGEPTCRFVLRDDIKHLIAIPHGVCPPLTQVSDALFRFAEKAPAVAYRQHDRRSRASGEFDLRKALRILYTALRRNTENSQRHFITTFAGATLQSCNLSVGAGTISEQAIIQTWLEAFVSVHQTIRSCIEMQSILMEYHEMRLSDTEALEQLEVAVGRSCGTFPVRMLDALFAKTVIGPSYMLDRFRTVLSMSHAPRFKTLKTMRNILACDTSSRVGRSVGFVPSRHLARAYMRYRLRTRSGAAGHLPEESEESEESSAEN